MKNRLEGLIRATLESTFPGQLPSDLSIPIEIPSQSAHGDYATSVAMALARPLKKAPKAIAEALQASVRIHPDGQDWIHDVQIAGPGYLNFFLKESYLQQNIKHILSRLNAGMNMYGATNIGNNERIIVEYVSANPTGPLHIGHGRWAVIGDVISNLLAAIGYSVIREFYVNDAGKQVLRLAESIKAIIDGSEIPEDGYHGESIRIAAEKIKNAIKDSIKLSNHYSAEELLAPSINLLREEQRITLENIGVKFNIWKSETELYREGKVVNALKRLDDSGFTYKKDGATWFRSTDLGDDKDRVLIKENGEYTYLVADIAYHVDKFERKAVRIINIWGADHHGYVARVKAAVQALGYDPDQLEIIIGQLVRLFRGTEQVRMSKRTGELITLQEVVDEIGPDAVRFNMLTSSADSHLDFDLELAKSQSNENPVYYVQYAHARISSIVREAESRGVKLDISGLSPEILGTLTHASERAMMKKLLELPDEVRESALLRTPHRMTQYAIRLAQLFHVFYHDCRVLTDDPALTQARLALCQATRTAISNVLMWLGVSAPEKM